MNNETKIARLKKLARKLVHRRRKLRRIRRRLAQVLPQVVWTVSGLPSKAAVTIKYTALPSHTVSSRSLNHNGSVYVTVKPNDTSATWTATVDNKNYQITPASGSCNFSQGRHKDISLVVSSKKPGVPTVTGLSPGSGSTAGGTIVTITGTNLSNATKVKFGTTAVTHFNSNSATQIRVAAPAHAAQTVNVTVITAGGTSTISNSDKFIYEAPVSRPTISGVSPSTGSTAGGTSVTITGTNLANATRVKFGTTTVTPTSNTATHIVVTAPAHAAQTVDITVTTAGGTSAKSSADQFIYATPPTTLPVISSVSPSTGSTAGGTTVTITGTNLASATTVRFGTTAVTSFTSNSSTQIVLAAPAHSAGLVDITVTTANGTSATRSADHFTYIVPVPTVSGISPANGSTAGGTTVTITGTNLSSASSVRFGTTAVTSFTSNSSTQIVLTSPAHAVGLVDVTVTTENGTSATGSADHFTYVTPTTPIIDEVVPQSGSTLGGTSVTITGTNFTGVTLVTFDGYSATINSNDSTHVVVTTPAHAAGLVYVAVTTPGGTGTTADVDRYSYVTPSGGSFNAGFNADFNR